MIARGFLKGVDFVVTRGFYSFTQHRAETILKAIKRIIGEAGYSVVRDRAHPPETLPSISVNQGEDSREPNPSTMAMVESNLDVEIEILVKADNYSSEINRIRSDIYKAMLESNRLALPYVEKLRWISDSAPEVDSESETVTALCNMSFEVGYVHSLNDKDG